MSNRLMSVSSYARWRNCSRQSVYVALRTGRIRRTPDGLIDVEAADRQWRDNTAPSVRGMDATLSQAELEALLDG